jgi:hypothetical protein
MEIPIATARLTADFDFFTKSALNRLHSERSNQAVESIWVKRCCRSISISAERR